MESVEVHASAAAVRAADVTPVMERLRSATPLVQCLTNDVVTGFTANVLLAAGASPAMVDSPEESAEFAQVADAVLINVGTPNADSAAAMRAAASAAEAAGTPWVLDPVAVGAVTFRTRLATDLLLRRPTVVRGNASEILSLAGASGAGRGVDSTADSAAAVQVACDLARDSATTVAVSGAVDYVTDGDRLVQVATGHELMTRVTGVGCALGALIAACSAVEESPVTAAAAATALLTVAGEIAGEAASGPGSFAVALLDALHGLDAGTLASHLEVHAS